jgi:hypothetical protein
MQMFLFAPLVLVPIYYMKILGLVFLGLVTLGSVLSPLIVYTQYNFLPTMMPGLPNHEKYFPYIYISAYSRCGPYVIGLGAGYIMHMTRGKKIGMSKVSSAAGLHYLYQGCQIELVSIRFDF